MDPSEIIALVAVVIAVFALLYSRASAVEARKANTISERALAIKEDEERRSWVRFELEKRSEGRYELRNVGTKVAPDVIVDLGDMGEEDTYVMQWNEFAPGQVAKLNLSRTFDTESDVVVVHWQWPDGTRESQDFLID